MFKRTIISASIFGMAAMAPPAMAQFSQCAPRDMLVAELTAKYGELPSAGGLRSEQHMMEIWAAPDTGSWTALMTTAEGISCIMATGTNWHQEKRLEVVNDIPS